MFLEMARDNVFMMIGFLEMACVHSFELTTFLTQACMVLLFLFQRICLVHIVSLAHLSRRLTGGLIVYPCSGVRPLSVVHNFKDLLL